MEGGAGAPIFVEQAWDFQHWKKDLFRVIDPATGQVFIFEAPIMQANISSAARAFRDYRTSQSAEIIEFPCKEVAN